MPAAPKLRISGLTKSFDPHATNRVLDHVSVEVGDRELLVLLGPSGCGKTTLLRCVAGLEDGQEGSIAFSDMVVFDAAAGVKIPSHKRDIGMVFQNYSLWPHMTVRRNIDYPLRMRGMRASDRATRVEEMLHLVRCEELAERLPVMLSGGQQQRVALARALASRPSLMLFDEPLSNLDALLRLELAAQLRTIHRELGFSGIYVTHDQAEAFSLGTRIAVMNRGRIEQIDTPRALYTRPETEFVATFFGFSNTVALVRDGGWSSLAGPLSGDLTMLGDATALSLFAKPADVAIARPETTAPDGGTLRLGNGRVTDAVFGGGVVDYVLQFGDRRLTARIQSQEAQFAAGDAVDMLFSRRSFLLYAEGRLHTLAGS